jgi:periplasmic protein TonB
MSAVQITLKLFMTMSYSFPSRPMRSPLHERIAVVGLVILLHAAAFAVYWSRPQSPAVRVNEMSISFANMQMPQADVTPHPTKRPRPVFKPVPHDPAPAPAPVERQTAEAPVAPPATPPSPVVLDTQPDYRADYLNNPRPPYPMAARRMGYDGKVILNVEVLAEGKAGQVLVYQSSGHDMLDNAALQTVKTWRFTPARHLGQPVTQWFLVPIKFSLEDHA